MIEVNFSQELLKLAKGLDCITEPDKQVLIIEDDGNNRITLHSKALFVAEGYIERFLTERACQYGTIQAFIEALETISGLELEELMKPERHSRLAVSIVRWLSDQGKR